MSDFNSKLESEIEDRASTLSEIEKIVFTKRYNLSKKHIDIISVQSISMIYSIWEGFIQNAFGIFIYELNLSEILFENFNDSIRIFHLENTFKQFRAYPSKQKNKIPFHQNLREFHLTERHKLIRAIDTNSNVGFDTLNDLLGTFCLEKFSEHWENYKHPLPNLKDMLNIFLRYRNAVSHGGDISGEEIVTQKVYAKYKKLVIDLMYEINEKMIYGIEKKTFLKTRKSI